MSLSKSQYHAIVWASHGSSIISLSGSLFVVGTFLFSSHFQSSINRLIFYASWGNIITNVGSLMSRGPILNGPDRPWCQFQAFILHWYYPFPFTLMLSTCLFSKLRKTRFAVADSFWTLCMAFNVYLTFFHRYKASDLRRLEKAYFMLCYGIPFIPSFVYLFVKTKRKGKIYGSGLMWCWVRKEWSELRLATFYAPVWFAIVSTLVIYALAGRKILESRRQLKKFEKSTKIAHQKPNLNPGHNEAEPRDRSGSEIGIIPKPNSDVYELEDPSEEGQSCTPIPSTQSGHDLERVYSRNTSIQAHSAAFAYARVAILFLVALLAIWIPATVNRLYGFIVPQKSPFVTSLIAGIVLPMQGFWNCVIYIVTSFGAVKALFAMIKQRFRGPNSTNPPVRSQSQADNTSEGLGWVWKGLQN